MTGVVLPFPILRRRGFVHRHASWMATLPAKGADGYLRQQIKVQRDTMERKGVEPDRIAVEVAAFESAVRAELSHYAGHFGGVA